MAFWDEEKKGTAMKKGSLGNAVHAAQRAFRPALSAFLAFAMVTGSVPAPAYAEMLDEAAQVIAIAQQEGADESAAPADDVTPVEGGASTEDAADTAEGAPASQGNDPQSAPAEPQQDASEPQDPAQDADNAPAEEPVQALYSKSDDLSAATLSADALASREAAVKALEDAGAAAEDAEAAADALLNDAPEDEAAAQPASEAEEFVKVSTKWITKSDDPNGDANAITIKPSGNNAQSVRIRVDFELDSVHDFEPGTVSITVPGSIFRDRNGKKTGKFVLSVPAEPSTTAGWNYRHVVSGDRDEYIITNTRRLSAATQGFMEFAYIDLVPSKLVDMQPSEQFKAKIDVVTDAGDVVTDQSNSIAARFDTYAKVTGANKSLYDAPRSVSKNDPEVKLAAVKYPDAPYFIVVDWYITCTTSANQEFKLSIKDEVSDNLGGVILDEGATYEGEPNKGNATLEKDGKQTFFNGTSAYELIKVAYPSTSFEDGQKYQFENKITYTLTEADEEIEGGDEQEVTVKSDSATEGWVFYEPHFIEPKGHFNMYKYGNDNEEYSKGGDAFATHHPVTGSTFPDVNDSGVTAYNGYTGLYGTALNDLRDGNDIDVSYTLNSFGYLLPWTYELPENWDGEGNPQGVLDNYGKHPVRMATEDQGMRLSDQDLEVLKDYEYASVTFPMKPVVKDAKAINLDENGNVDFSSFDNGTVDYVTDEDPAHTPDVVVEVKTKGSNDWRKHATASWTSGELKLAREDGTTVSGTTVQLPQNTTAVRTVTETKRAGVLYFVRVNIKIKQDGAVGDVAKGAFADSKSPVVLAYNDAEMRVSLPDENNRQILSVEKAGVDKLMGYTTDVRASMKKSAERFDVDHDVDQDKGRVTLHYKAEVTKQSFITNKDVYEDAVKENEVLAEREGTFYDLLPKGATPDLGSVKLRGGDLITSLFTIENYRGTGRTMLVVRGKFTPDPERYYEGGVSYYQDRLQIAFDAWYGLDDFRDFGGDLHNVIAYQSKNDQVGTVDGYRGEYDDPSPENGEYNNHGTKDAFKSESEEILDAMADLDESEPNSPNVLYAGVAHTINPVTQGEVGLSKKVEVNGDGYFGTGTEGDRDLDVYTGGTYTYRLSTRARANEHVTGIVMYDVLESYVPSADEEPEGTDAWHGTIRGVDLSSLEHAGCSPVLYYSTVQGLSLYDPDPNNPAGGTEHKDKTDLDNKEVWTKTTPKDLAAMPEAQRKKITAIAIDARQAKDGGNFEISEGDVATAFVHMAAPRFNGGPTDIKPNSHAFNNLCMKGTTASTTDPEGVESFIHVDYTKVGLKPYELRVVKEWDDEDDRDGKRPESVEVELLANGGPTNLTASLSEANKWSHTFENLDRTDGDGKVIEYTLRETGADGYELGLSFDQEKGTYTLNNRRDPERTSVSGTKTWVGDSADVRPDRIVVKLYADGEFVDSKTVRSNGTDVWSYTFDNLYKYKDGKEIVYTVKEELPDGSYIPSVDGANITNEYHPYGDLVVSKTTEGDTTPATKGKEFEFTFTFLKDGKPLFDEFEYEITPIDGAGEAEPVAGKVSTNDTIKLTSGQKATIKELPKDVTYTVKEASLPGFTAEGSDTVTGEIEPNKTMEAKFHNVYQASTEVTVQAGKKLTGHKLSPYRFMFELRDKDNNVVSRASNGAPSGEPTKDENGNIVSSSDVTFGALTFTQADDGVEHVYTMHEITRSGSGYACDQTVYTVKVTPQDNGDGTMSVDVAYLRPDGTPFDEGEFPLFENVYTATGSVSLGAHKTLKGGDLKDGQFEFELGEIVEGKDGKLEFQRLGNTVKNQANGTVTFKPVMFDQTDAPSEHTYVIREVVPQDTGSITYDRHVALVEVKVADNHDGTLSVESKMDNVVPRCFECDGMGKLDGKDCPVCKDGTITSTVDSLKFENSYKPAGLEIEKTLAADSAQDDPNHTFKFELELTNERGEKVGGLADELRDGAQLVPLSGEQDGNGSGADGAAADADAAAVEQDAKKPSSRKASDKQDANKQNPLEAFGSWAMNALTSLFAPEPAYAAEPKVTEWQQEQNGDWRWMVDADGTLRIAGNVHDSSTHDYDRHRWPWNKDQDNIVSGIKRVEFESGSTASGKLDYFFGSLKELEAIDLSNLDVSGVTSMVGMFYSCSASTIAFGTSFNTAQVADMTRMFQGCTSLTSVSVAAFDTASVTNMGYMFAGCNKLASIDLGSIDTGSVVNMESMFDGCWQLREIDLAGLNMSSVKKMDMMFRSCFALESVSFGEQDLENVEDMSNMFSNCNAIEKIDLSSVKVKNVKFMSGMFLECSSLREINFGNINTSSVEDMGSMFKNCTSLRNLDLKSFTTEALADTAEMFWGASNLTSISFGDFAAEHVVDMHNMFYKCSGLINLDLSSFRGGSVTKTSLMFSECNHLEDLKLPNLDTSQVTDMRQMFQKCSSLKTLDLSSLDTSQVTDMVSMFDYCSSLQNLTIGEGFDTSKVEEMDYMFNSCKSLETFDLNQLEMSSVTSLSCMFQSCESLSEVDMRGIDTGSVTNMGSMFKSCKKLQKINMSGIDTSSVTSMRNMFNDCTSLVSIDMRGLNVDSLTSMRAMFANCTALESVDMTELKTSSVTDMVSLFSGCKSLKEVKLAGVDVSNVAKMESMFADCGALEMLDLSDFDMAKAETYYSMFMGSSKLRAINLPSSFKFKNPGLNPRYKWVKVDTPDSAPADDAKSYTLSELEAMFPGSGESGWYVWDTFATFAFNPGEGGIGSAPNQKANILNEDGVTLDAPNFVRFGYKIESWVNGTYSFPETAEGKIHIDQETAEKLFDAADGSPITLVAKWVEDPSGGVTEENGKYYFEVPAGYVLKLPNVIPSGTNYVVRELDEDGWKLVSSSNESGVISSENEQAPRAAFVNTKGAPEEPAAVRVELSALKLLDGAIADASHGFSFSMTGYDPATGTLDKTWTATVDNSGHVFFDTLEFSVDDLGGKDSKTFEYTIAEDQGGNPAIEYDQTRAVASVTISKDADGKLSKSVKYQVDGKEPSADAPVFHNATRPGTLSITKEIKGTLSDVAKNQSFSFKVRIDGAPYTGSYQVGSDTLKTADGTISLKGGQTAVVSKVAAGSSYSVEEIDIPAGWTLDGDSMRSGVVEANSAVSLTFTNTYSATGAAQLMAYKDFPGGELTDGKFAFALHEGDTAEGKLLSTAVNGPVDTNETIPGEGGNDVDNPHYGMAPVYFEEISYSAPGEHTYTIVEQVPADAVNADDVKWSEADDATRAKGGFALDGVVYDSTVRHAKVTVTDKGNGTLATEVSYMDAQNKPAEHGAVFTNTLQNVGLDITKVVTNDFGDSPVHKDDEYEFKVTLEDAAGKALKDVQYTVVDAAEGASGNEQPLPENGIITLKAGQTAQFRDLPYGARYQVEEQQKDGWTVNTEESSGDLAGVLTDPNNPVKVTVANTYDASGSFDLTARKDYDGKLEAGMFTFGMVEVLEGGETAPFKTATNDAEGNIPFGTITYGLESAGKSYTYRVFEEKGDVENVAYDDTVYTVVVTVRDEGNGTLACDVVYRDEALDPVEEIVFTNRRTFDLPFTGGGGIGMAGVAVLALGCAAFLFDRKRKLKA